MAEIEIALANMGEYPILSQIDLSFESDYVWRSQMVDDLNSYSISFQKIKLPKTIKIPFQALNQDALENMVKRKEILSIRYEQTIVGFMRLERDESVNHLILKTGGLRPEYRHKGIGTALLTRMQDIAIQNRIHYIVGMLQAKNDPAIRFMLSRGFQFCGFQEFFFPNMEIGLFFSKNVR